MIKFPVTIKNDLADFFKITNNGKVPVRIGLNYVWQNSTTYRDLFHWLFNVSDFEMNQVKFANFLGGSDYEFTEPEYMYQTKDGRFIGYNETTKVFTLGIKGNALGNKIRNNLTRDDILDSPFDINKLIEVPYNGEEEENAD